MGCVSEAQWLCSEFFLALEVGRRGLGATRHVRFSAEVRVQGLEQGLDDQILRYPKLCLHTPFLGLTVRFLFQ